jgi:hypothetical protein
MDLMIEAKDKEQAVFALRRKWNIEGGLPDEWIMKGEKTDENREIPSEMGNRVFYDEGEEWRFKAPLKMPIRIQKMLDWLNKQRDNLGEDATKEAERLEPEGREKRIKWRLEKGPEMEHGIGYYVGMMEWTLYLEWFLRKKTLNIPLTAPFARVFKIPFRTFNSRPKDNSVHMHKSGYLKLELENVR